MAVWFILMVSSVALAYYFYLKSERLERELRDLRQQVGLPAQADSGEIKTVVIPEGVPPEAFEETTGSVVLPHGSSAPSQEAVAIEATPAPTFSPTPEAANSRALQRGTTGASEVAATPVSPAVTREASPAPSASAEITPVTPHPRSTPRPSRIGSVYDIPKESPRR